MCTASSKTGPTCFKHFADLVDGQAEAVTQQQRRELRARHFLARDSSPLPGPKSIIQAAFRQVGDGPCLVDPIDVRTPEDAARLRQVDELIEQQQQERMVRLFDRFTKPRGGSDKGKGKGRS